MRNFVIIPAKGLIRYKNEQQIKLYNNWNLIIPNKTVVANRNIGNNNNNNSNGTNSNNSINQ